MANEQRVEILRIEVDQKTAANELAKLEQELVRLRKEQEGYKKALKESNGTNSEAAKSLVAVNSKIKESAEKQKELTKAINTQSGSLDALRGKLGQLTRERNKIDTSTDAGKKKFNELTKQIKTHSDSIKKAEEAGGDFRRSVGNYQRALENVGGPIGEVRDKIRNVGEAMGKAGPIGVGILALVGIVKLAIGDISKFFESWEGQLSESGRKLEAIKLAHKSTWRSMSEERGKALAEAGPGGWFGVLWDQFSGFLTMSPLAFMVHLEKLRKEYGATEEEAQKVVDAQLAWKKSILDSKVPLANVRKEMEINENIFSNKSGVETMEARVLAHNKFLDGLEQENIIEDNITALELNFLELSGKLTKNKFDEELKIQELKAEQIISDKENADATANALKRMKDINKSEAERLELIKLRKEQEGNITAPIFGVGDKRPGETELDAKKRAEEELKQLVRDEGFAELQTKEELNQALVNGVAKRQTEIEKLTEASAKRQLVIEQIKNQAIIESTAFAIGSLGDLAKKDSATYRILKSAEAVISTYAAITKTLAEPSLPFPANVIASVGMGITGFANVAAINGVQFASGGRIGNRGVKLKPDRRGDNRLIVASDKEVILNSRHQARIGADRLKSAGVPGFADGGFIGSKAGQGVINNFESARSITESIRNFPAPVVSVEEFTRVENRVRIKERVSRG